MNLTRRLATVLTALALLLTSIVLAPVGSVDAQAGDPGPFSLHFSTSLDRSGPSPLDGATVPANQDLAVFLTTPAEAQVGWTVFFVDDQFAKLEFDAPYDLAGTNPDGSAAPTQLVPGNYSIAAWYETPGGLDHVVASFTVSDAPPPPVECSTIAEIATGDGNFSTLVTALSAATEAGNFDFLGAVSNPDADLTVFAPTNAAFAALDPAVLEAALADPGGLLTQVLAYHVLGSSLTGAELLAAGTATTLEGSDVTISFDPLWERVLINDSGVALADVDACNGIVHVIDNVLLPTPPPVECSTIAEIAVGDPDNFSTLVTALSAATEAGNFDFLGAVSNPDADLTVFAPTNAAFAALDPAVLEAALADPGGLLTQVLAYHVLGTSETGTDLVAAGTATTLQGTNVTVTTNNGNVFINNSQVVIADIDACNGIIHVIDNVLLPAAPPAPEVIADGEVIVLRNLDRDRFLDADPGRQVDLSTSVIDDDKWILEAIGDGSYRLRNLVYGSFLDADGRSSGYRVDLNRNPNAHGVEWEILEQDNGAYVLRNVDYGRFLDTDPNNNVDTSSSVRSDDLWEITLAD